MTRIAITGAMGLIGTKLAAICNSYEVIAVDFWPSVLARYEAIRHPALPSIYRTLSHASEVLEPGEFIDSMVALSPDIIVHLGAVVDTMDMASISMIEQNVRYVRALVAKAQEVKGHVPSIVFASSAAVYGSDFTRPNNPYGLTKAIGENLVRETRGSHACLRLFNVFGAHEHHKGQMASIPFKLAESYRTGNRFDMHSLSASRDFVSVSCVAHSILRVCKEFSEMPKPMTRGITYDIGTGESTSFTDLDNMVMQAMGCTASIVREVPVPEHLIGRYQKFTKAGISSAPLLGPHHTTREGIEEQYGNR